MKINYVIATFEGQCNRKHKYPRKNDILKMHLYQLLELDHNLSQITIMKPYCDKNIIKGYYDIDDIIKQFNVPIKIIECKNYGYSCGQWLKNYEINSDFDYYICMEDDYCFNKNNFDKILVDYYNNVYPNNIGNLYNIISVENETIEYYGGLVFISNDTFKKLYNCDKWEKNPLKHLNLIDEADNECFHKLRKRYIGAYYQVAFSYLFTMANIKHKSIVDTYDFIYWCDNNNKCLLYNKDYFNKLQYNNIVKYKKTSICIPVQIIKHIYLQVGDKIKENVDIVTYINSKNEEKIINMVKKFNNNYKSLNFIYNKHELIKILNYRYYSNKFTINCIDNENLMYLVKLLSHIKTVTFTIICDNTLIKEYNIKNNYYDVMII